MASDPFAVEMLALPALRQRQRRRRHRRQSGGGDGRAAASDGGGAGGEEEEAATSRGGRVGLLRRPWRLRLGRGAAAAAAGAAEEEEEEPFLPAPPSAAGDLVEGEGSFWDFRSKDIDIGRLLIEEVRACVRPSVTERTSNPPTNPDDPC